MKGIDYSMGQTNIDQATGIRYGVISHNECLQAWFDSSEAQYGDPTCPKCGNEVKASKSKKDFYCAHCRKHLWSEDCFGDEPVGYTLDDGEYKASQSGGDNDIFITKSPYYSLCQFCSPCAPGAGYLMDEQEDGIKAYCFGHDWFEGGVAPYTVYRVSDDTVVEPEREKP